ncbi:hypothetical protein E2C01_016551 [Portunus trituberculatus]|uniref:Uncharacterized protein n=1 Tax=Portunus trituberculatus TaxID=210409 RepID=A0A5B7DPC7_PORTR|nr:hypothetical protein [Portunus trituberculatus]
MFYSFSHPSTTITILIQFIPIPIPFTSNVPVFTSLTTCYPSLLRATGHSFPPYAAHSVVAAPTLAQPRPTHHPPLTTTPPSSLTF